MQEQFVLAFHKTDFQVCPILATQLPYSLCDPPLHYNLVEVLAHFPTIYGVRTSAGSIRKVNCVGNNTINLVVEISYNP
jgi:hypothetical protein